MKKRIEFQLTNLQERPIPGDSWFSDLLTVTAEVVGPLPTLSIALVDDAHISEIHDRFLGDSTPTDVISFPLDKEEGPRGRVTHGEVVISMDTAAREAARLDCTVEEELALYLIHGVLHLVGHDDLTRDDFERMVEEEKRVLNRLNITPRDR